VKNRLVHTERSPISSNSTVDTYLVAQNVSVTVEA